MSKIFYLGQIFNGIDILTTTAFFCGLIDLAVFIIWFIAACCEGYEKGDNEYETAKKGIKWSLIVAIVGIVANTIIPSRTTWYLMKGGDAVEKAATSKEVSKTAEKTLKLVNQYLDEKLNRTNDNN